MRPIPRLLQPAPTIPCTPQTHSDPGLHSPPQSHHNRLRDPRPLPHTHRHHRRRRRHHHPLQQPPAPHWPGQAPHRHQSHRAHRRPRHPRR
ncbi:hypothetical protein BST30_28565, partial [Mycobacterium mantenii]